MRNQIYFQTLRETDARLQFAQGDRTAFPILLVLSDINWRPLDDFYRLKPEDGGLTFKATTPRKNTFPERRPGEHVPPIWPIAAWAGH